MAEQGPATQPTPAGAPDPASPSGTAAGSWGLRAVWAVLAGAIGFALWYLFIHDHSSKALDPAAYAERVCTSWDTAGSAMAAAWEAPGAGSEPAPTATALRRSAESAERLADDLARAGVPADTDGDAVLGVRDQLTERAASLRAAATEVEAAVGAAVPGTVADVRAQLTLPLVGGDGPDPLGPAFAADPVCRRISERLAAALP
ncbi:MAG: hypothetical protein IPM45_05500 [Acidimicrobiales bacterium]|nr:hypothetical protein [Acidimicrobiales bacterium]